MKRVLIGAGVFGILFAAWCIFLPDKWFTSCGMACVTYRETWMTVGMLNGVLGIGLLLAASNPIRHWSIVLLALLAKVFACVGFAWALSRGVFPLKSSYLIFFNDFIWIFPLLAILWNIAQTYAGRSPLRETPYSLKEAMQNYQLNSGETLLEASQENKLTVVFLRHFGCTFTRQLMRKLGSLKEDSEKNNSRLVLVHMLQHGEEEVYLDSDDIARVSDPYCELYRTFGLGKGGILELFGPTVILQAVLALIKGCGVGHLAGDGLQLPGAFVVKNGEIIRAQRAKTAAGLPQLEKLFNTSAQTSK